MNRILLIRHGVVERLGEFLYGRTPGVHLTPEGQAQARTLAAALQMRYTISAIVSSPLDRAIETAHPIADVQRVPLATDQGFTEVDFAAWSGKSFAELKNSPEWLEYNRVRSLTRAPGGESLIEVQARAWESLQLLNARYADATVGIVTHGDVIRTLLVLFLGMPLDHIGRIEVAPASVSEVLLGAEPVVKSVNWTPPESMRDARA